MIEYKCVSLREAIKNGYSGAEEYEDYGDYELDWCMGIWMFHNGVATKLLRVDGGEPEDNSFNRDGSWITPALNEAYKLGYLEGIGAPS
jgi:hypothetical protein